MANGQLVTINIQLNQSVLVTKAKLLNKPHTRRRNDNEEFVKATTQTHKELLIYASEEVVKSKNNNHM